MGFKRQRPIAQHWKRRLCPTRSRSSNRSAICSPNRGGQMAVEIVMPRLGWTMEEGVVVEWLKHDGDAVKVGDVTFTVESDKALNEVESFEDGILRIPPDSPPPGEKVPVGGLLAYLVKPGETVPFETGSPSSATQPSIAQTTESGQPRP